LWQGGADSDHRQPNDYLQERRDPINKLSQREALAAMTNVIARIIAPVNERMKKKRSVLTCDTKRCIIGEEIITKNQLTLDHPAHQMIKLPHRNEFAAGAASPSSNRRSNLCQ